LLLVPFEEHLYLLLLMISHMVLFDCYFPSPAVSVHGGLQCLCAQI